MFSMRTRGIKAFTAEQKIMELKTIFLKNKRVEKRLDARIRPNELIKKATGNLNKTCVAKYGFTPDQIEKESIEDDNYTNIYNLHRFVRVKEHENRTVRYARKQDNRKEKS